MKMNISAVLGLILFAGNAICADAPKKAEDYYNEAVKAVQGGDCVKAQDLLLSAQATDRKWQAGKVGMLIAKCEMKEGKYFQASNTLREVLRNDPSKNDPAPYRMMGEALVREKRGSSAEETLQAGIKIYPNDPILHDLLRQAYEIQKQDDKAKKEGAKAEQLAFGKAKADTKNAFVLPFEGEWLVKQGNTGKVSHFGLQEKFAWDFEKTDGKGNTFDGKAQDKKLNEASLSWKAPVLAPADGEVVVAVNGVRDNTLSGDMNRNEPMGNYIVIKHGEGEYSILGHLLKEGVEVKVGDVVKAGQKVASCGNSGLSPEPQLHFSVLSEFEPALCRPANLNRYEVVGGKVVAVASGMPKEGEVIRMQAEGSASSTVMAGALADTRSPTGAVKEEKPVVAAKEEKKKEEPKKEEKKDKDGAGIGLGGLGLLGGAAGVAAGAAGGAGAVAGAAEGAKGAAAGAAAGAASAAASNAAGNAGNTPSTNEAGQGDQTGQGDQGDKGNNGVRDHGQGEGRDGAGQGKGQGLDNGLKGGK